MNVEALTMKFQNQGSPDIFRLRYGQGTYRDGIYSAALESRTKINASLQPLTSSTPGATPDMLLRASVHYVCFTVSELQEPDEKKKVRGDLLEIGGVKYAVVSVLHYPFLGGHYQAIIKRETA